MMKELVMVVASQMPDNASIEEIIDAIFVRLSINQGLKDIEDGKVTTHNDLLKEFEEW